MKGKNESGFSYIDVMIALVILLVGVLALVAAIAGSLMTTMGQKQQVNAKQYATSTMESINSAKETAPNPNDPTTDLGWTSVGNVGRNPDANGVPQGIFVNGVQNVRASAGPDEILGTADDAGALVPGLTREIVINDLCDADRPSSACSPPGSFPVRNRQVTVTINYFVGRLPQREVITTLLTDTAPVN